MKYIDGNLLTLAEQGQFDYIVHGCNCQNTMGSGIAGQIARKYPKAFMVDQLTERGDASKLGKFTQAYLNGMAIHSIGPGIRGVKQVPYSFTIINAYTQEHFGTDRVHVDYEAMFNVFKQIKMLYDMNPMAPARIGIPQIGSDRAGGDWTIIESIIDGLGFSDLTCVIYNQ